MQTADHRYFFFFSSRRRHTRLQGDWSSDVCSSDLLFAATDAQVAWTAGKLRELGVAYLLGAHCTGIEATYRLREIIGLTRKTAVVGAVGASFTLGKGLDPLGLAG